MFGNSEWDKNKFSFEDFKLELGRQAFRKEKEAANQPDLEIAPEALKEISERAYKARYIPETREDYLLAVLRSSRNLDHYLEEKEGIVFSPEELLEFNEIQHKGIYRHDSFDIDKSRGFFTLTDAPPAMCLVKNIPHELALSEMQAKEMLKEAETPGERVAVGMFQGLRTFGTHPAADGNSRLFKAVLHKSISENFSIDKMPETFPDIPEKTVRQAVYGNNLQPMMDVVSKAYGIDVDLGKYQHSPYRVMHSGHKPVKQKLEKAMVDSKIVRDGEKQVYMRVSDKEELKVPIKYFFSSKMKNEILALDQPQKIDDYLCSLKRLEEKGVLSAEQLNHHASEALSVHNGRSTEPTLRDRAINGAVKGENIDMFVKMPEPIQVQDPVPGALADERASAIKQIFEQAPILFDEKTKPMEQTRNLKTYVDNFKKKAAETPTVKM